MIKCYVAICIENVAMAVYSTNNTIIIQTFGSKRRRTFEKEEKAGDLTKFVKKEISFPKQVTW